MEALGQATASMNSTSFPSDHYCPICKELVPQKQVNFLGVMKWVQPRCNCEVRQKEKELRESEELMRKREIESRFSISNLGERFNQCTFEAFKARMGASEVSERVLVYADHFEARNASSVVIWGNPGNGKSHLAAAAAKRIKERGNIVVFQSVPELLGRIKSTFDASNKETERQVMYALTECDLLVLDDIGAENVTGWVLDVLFRIIDGRYRSMKPIFYTTNHRPQELAEKVGPRIFDRILETSIILENKASSYRMEQAKARMERMRTDAGTH